MVQLSGQSERQWSTPTRTITTGPIITMAVVTTMAATTVTATTIIVVTVIMADTITIMDIVTTMAGVTGRILDAMVIIAMRVNTDTTEQAGQTGMDTMRGTPIPDIRQRLENAPGRQERQQTVTVTGIEEGVTAHPIDTTVVGEERQVHLERVRTTTALHTAAYGIAELRGNGLQHLSYKQPSKRPQYVPQHCHQHSDRDECS